MDFSVIPDNLAYMMEGLATTIFLAAVGMAASLVTGTLFAMMRLSALAWIRLPAGVFVDVMRTIPLIMVIFWFFFLLPYVTGSPVTPLMAALLALIVFNTSYMAEVVRAGILSVPRTQNEAARSAGLSYLAAMWYVILPQAFRNMLPAVVSRFIALFMGTSLAYVIGVTEFFRAANNVNNRVYQSYVIFGFVAAVYFVCCYGLSLLSRHLMRRLDPSAREAAARWLPRSLESA
jgi:His/Glu/Gln/Arg/opine family amino acid ABC transporter permease subunit